MSDILRSRDAERTARVWQPADFLHGDGQGEAFVPKRWRKEAGFQFERMPEPQAGASVLPAPAEEQAPLPNKDDAGRASKSKASPEAEPTATDGGVSQQALEEARVQAYQKGLEHGRREAQEQARQAQEASQAQVLERLSAMQAALDDLRQSPEQLYEPLKRLALHLAEQLVLAELSQSPQGIERLVRRCVDELGSAKASPVRIELHPDDLAVLQPALAASRAEEAGDGEGCALAWQLQADAALRPGSVRASAQDAVVTDLIEHRLEELARQLRVDPVRASRQSAFQPERIASRRAEVDHVLDAQPRMAEAPRNPRFSPVVEAEASVASDVLAPLEPQMAPWPEDTGFPASVDPEPTA